jgi:hypothetical protein
LYCSRIRPRLSVPVLNEISPAICFKGATYLDNVIGTNGTSFTDQVLANLNIGKRHCGFEILQGTLQSGLTGNTRAYSALSSTAAVTRAMVSLDSKELVSPWFGSEELEWNAFVECYGPPAGLLSYNFLEESGNPDAAFPAEQLTAARRFQINADVTAASGKGGELLQIELLGSPAIGPQAQTAAASSNS